MSGVLVNNQGKSPYENAQAVWDKRMGLTLKEAKTWRLATMTSLALLFFSIAGNIYLGQQKKMVPYVVEIKPNGESSAVNALAGLSGPAINRATKYFLSRFVMLAREIPADAVLLRDNMNKLFQLVSMQGKALLSEQFKEKSPSAEFLEKNRALKIESVLAVSEGMYYVNWREAEYDKQGQKTAEYTMRGTFKIALLEPKSEGQIKENPLGIFIDYFSWTKLGG
jgi:type IV secretion system protein VirB5